MSHSRRVSSTRGAGDASRRTFMKGAATAAAVVGAPAVHAAAAVPKFPTLKLPDSPLNVDLSTLPNALKNDQIPRWTESIIFPQWLQPMSTGTLPKPYTSAVGDVLHGVAPEWFDHAAD